MTPVRASEGARHVLLPCRFRRRRGQRPRLHRRNADVHVRRRRARRGRRQRARARARARRAVHRPRLAPSEYVAIGEGVACAPPASMLPSTTTSQVEPTDASFQEAARFAADGRFDGFVSVGGGSVMDTCKAANLYASHPAEFMTYVNAPIGGGQQMPGPVKPHIACPTTSRHRVGNDGHRDLRLCARSTPRPASSRAG